MSPQYRRQIKTILLVRDMLRDALRERRCLCSYQQRQIDQSDREITANCSKKKIFQMNIERKVIVKMPSKIASFGFNWNAISCCSFATHQHSAYRAFRQKEK